MRLQKGFNIAMTLALLLGLLSVATIGGAYYFIDKTRNNTFEENIASLNTLQRLDAKWNESILKTRSYTLQDFDQLARYMIKIQQTLDLLAQKGMSNETLVGKATAKQYQIYKHSFAIKNEAIEHYKSEQAILRNSVRYLPEAGDVAQHSLADSKHKEITTLLLSSILATNQYLLGVVDANVTKNKLAMLKQQSTNKSTVIKNNLEDYLLHSNLVMKHKPKVEEMLQTAMSLDLAKLSTQLINEYIRSQDTVKARIKYWQHIMLAGIIMLLVLLVWFLLSLRKSASKILLANTKNKAIQQQLMKAEKEIKRVNEQMAKTGEQAAAGQLSLNAFKHLNTAMPSLATDISFLKMLKTNSALSQYTDKINQMINHLDDFHSNIQELNMQIHPSENKEKQASFNFNHIIQSAFDSISSNIDSSATFNKQLSAVPTIQASAIDLYQIASKLLHLSILNWKNGDESIFVKTWATGHYANLCLSLSGHDNLKTLYAENTLIDLRELLEKNSALLKLTPREDGKSAIIWVSFPYGS